jgi:hypothetical protein
MSAFAILPTNLGEDLSVDSLVLSLQVSSVNGDSLYAHNIHVYELTDTLYTDSTYYSNTFPYGKYNPDVELTGGVFNPSDSLITLTITDPDLLAKFENAPDTLFESISGFRQIFLGLYITTDSVSSEGGSILGINLQDEDTRINMYYQNDTTGTKTLEMFISVNTPRANTFYYDYEGSRATAFSEESGEQDSLMFISSLGGVDTRIDFPDLASWKADSGVVAINKAELYIPVADTLLTGMGIDDYPASLLLFIYNEDIDYDYLYDYRIDSDGNYFGGSYDSQENAYVFNIGMHLQGYLRDDFDDMKMILIANNNGSSYKQVILNGPNHTQRPAQLKITYTKF